MDTMLSVSELMQGLQRLGVRSGMALEVHCSLSRFGYLEGGAGALIHSLMQVVGNEGSLVMPAFRLSPNLPLTDEDRALGLTMKIKILPDDAEHSAMGIVADTFRNMENVQTGDGIFRVSAWGKDAAIHAQGFQHLIDNEGYALLLGVDIYRLSSMHYAEDEMPNEIRSRFAPSAEARAKYQESQWFIEAWIPEEKVWYKIQDAAYAAGMIRDIHIGNAKCMLLQVKPVIDLYREALRTHPFELYGLR